MRPEDSCKTCGGTGVAAFGNAHTKTISYYGSCTTCNGTGWSPEAIVRDGLDAKAIKDAVEFVRTKHAIQTNDSKDMKNLGNFQKYLDHLKSEGKWNADLMKTWDTVANVTKIYGEEEERP